MRPSRNCFILLVAVLMQLNFACSKRTDHSPETGQRSQTSNAEAATVSDEARMGEAEEAPADDDAKTTKLCSAREAFDIAQKTAVTWSADAGLAALSTFPTPPQPDGRATSWKLEFYSSSLDRELEVYVRRGELFQKREGRATKKRTIAGAWVDSTVAMETAAKRFGPNPAGKYWLGLSFRHDTPTWRIRLRPAEGKTVWLYVDAVTGEEAAAP